LFPVLDFRGAVRPVILFAGEGDQVVGFHPDADLVPDFKIVMARQCCFDAGAGG
jgi:hypothetical protein